MRPEQSSTSVSAQDRASGHLREQPGAIHAMNSRGLGESLQFLIFDISLTKLNRYSPIQSLRYSHTYTIKIKQCWLLQLISSVTEAKVIIIVRGSTLLEWA